ncbi:MAG TPA: efflux RND transporter periplasmic adaptor subunit [Hymenobacter sp.]|jgi:multidrug efflux pump subunit AcrA (membrane-fusion protein)|uniref:efflux RND transporter periplasmic adaptor subunit n=1 Tax=Hymenobacter sp. TaxID=1898978 RepID=UPI002ED911A8
MKKLLLVGGTLGVLALGGVWWAQPFSATPAEAFAAPTALDAAEATPDSTYFVAMGDVGAGGTDAVRAQVTGRVRKIYFADGEYVRGGQVLAKCYNYTYVLAPRHGFVGRCQITVGQYLTPVTVVTTLTKRSHLMVSLALPPGRQGSAHPGDSVRVWVASRPSRVETGVVGPAAQDSAGAEVVQIMLTSRAPFRIGERACVRLRASAPQLTSR